jgi:hypothetical protein
MMAPRRLRENTRQTSHAKPSRATMPTRKKSSIELHHGRAPTKDSMLTFDQCVYDLDFTTLVVGPSKRGKGTNS